MNYFLKGSFNRVYLLRRSHTQKNKMYSPGEEVHAAQLVVREKEMAEAILNRLKNGDDFGKVAKVESVGPESVKEAILDWLIPAFCLRKGKLYKK